MTLRRLILLMYLLRTVFCLLILAAAASLARAQSVAVLTPDRSETSRAFASRLVESLDQSIKVIDESVAESAFSSVAPVTPFNQTTDEARRIGTAIGCDIFILVSSTTQRRSSLQKSEYYESYAAIYVIGSRSGKLALWKLQQFESNTPNKSVRLLRDSVPALATELAVTIRRAFKDETASKLSPLMDEFPSDSDDGLTGLRAPVPYRRLKPEYTSTASLYDVKATVDMMIYLDAKGTILKTEVMRWAGFELDESVEKNVRAMNWRPAERDGKALATKFLVRYNFKKLD